MRWTNRWRRWGNNYPRRLTHRRAEIFSPFHRLLRQALTALSPRHIYRTTRYPPGHSRHAGRQHALCRNQQHHAPADALPTAA
ncbi:hypothetical protein ACFFJN_12115 [Erwinia mallotivora]|uniref:hypothetical protein n=1 Tax=Erwinia mallotivora TaxID=69222 RepID=UPI0035E56A3C